MTVTEITGSESFVHLQRDASNWVAVLPRRASNTEPGAMLDAVLDPDNLVRVRRGRPPGRRAAGQLREMRHGPH